MNRAQRTFGYKAMAILTIVIESRTIFFIGNDLGDATSRHAFARMQE
jgi:hypothetical protein